MNVLFSASHIATACGSVTVSTLCLVSAVAAAPCGANAPCASDVATAYPNPENEGPSWIFLSSTYTHDPRTGARVAQYMRTPPVEPLEDQRAITSRYRRSQTNLRGTDGSNDTYYEVQAWGNGRGGIDAEWERFHNAWKDSQLQGGYFNQTPNWGGRWNNGGRWNQGGPWNNNGPWNNGGNWNNGGPGFPGPGNGGWGGGGGWGQSGNNFPPNGPNGYGDGPYGD